VNSAIAYWFSFVFLKTSCQKTVRPCDGLPAGMRMGL
jgi:hypothetical protein